MWQGSVRTELSTPSAVPLCFGSGRSRDTPALDSFLQSEEVQIHYKHALISELHPIKANSSETESLTIVSLFSNYFQGKKNVW